MQRACGFTLPYFRFSGSVSSCKQTCKQHFSESGCCNWRDQFERLRRTKQKKALAEAVLALRTEVQPLIAQGDYTAVLDKLANLRSTVDAFFADVMVNAEDPALRPKPLSDFKTRCKVCSYKWRIFRYCNNESKKGWSIFQRPILLYIDFK